MSFEHYTPVYSDYENGCVLRAMGDGKEFTLPQIDIQENTHIRLFTVGESSLFYHWNDEPDYPLLYRTISDALDNRHAFRAPYCLNFSSSKNEKFLRRAYKKIMWPPAASYIRLNPAPENWQVGLWVTARNLHFGENGYVKMRLDIVKKRPGVSPHTFIYPPDQSIDILLPEGTYNWQKLTENIHISAEETAYTAVRIEGINYTGQIYIERPFIFDEKSGHNLLPDFNIPTSDKPEFDWTCQYLSRKEWPVFRVSADELTVFEGEIFERCHRNSEWEIDLPVCCVKKGARLKFELISDCHDPAPYIIHELGIIEQPDAPVSLIASAQSGTVSGGARILLRTKEDNTTVQFTFPDGRLSGKNEITFKEKGLHGVVFSCFQPCLNVPYTLSAGHTTIEGFIPRIVEKAEDHVLTGTGDMIYIEQRMDDAEEYLSWYVSNQIGNLLTIRPTYRWSGTRVLNPDVWKMVRRVLTELNIRYSHMMDGRELPGMNTNPDTDMLNGPCFLGRQSHERDGCQYYWNARFSSVMTAEQFNDMEQLIYQEDPSHVYCGHAPCNFIYKGRTIYQYRSPDMPRDTRCAMENSVRQLSAARGDTTRHTGPSVMFKYLYMAGYDWQGAETMYTSMEPLMAFLRGAASCYHKNSIGVHHALQWSSSPQDTPDHFRRYRLALYISYMQGACEINTEEGLWRLEENYSFFHRFTAGCQGHLKQQQDFYRYLSTHSRTGHFFAPMALLSGRLDGWHGFGNHHPWGWTEMPDSDAENSWQLMKVFYPLSMPGKTLYFHGCAADRPMGYYTGTPWGNVDVLPAEEMAVCLNHYPAVAFMGYNCVEQKDMEILSDYVHQGGKLLLSRAHLTDTTLFTDIASYQLHFAQTPFSFTKGEPQFVTGHVHGEPVPVCVNIETPGEVLAVTDEMLPLMVRYQMGKGTVTLLNAKAYPSHPAVRIYYEKELERMIEGLCRFEKIHKGWVACREDVQFTVYDQENGDRHIYMLATDWYHAQEPLRSCSLFAGGKEYTVSLPFGVMTKCVIHEKEAAWPLSEKGEVLAVNEKGATVQGEETVIFTLARDGIQKDVSVDFTQEPIQTILF